jgi:replicative DNA helicase
VNRAKAGEGAYIASLETQDGELMIRMLCAEARVSVHRARSGGMVASDLERMRDAKLALGQLPLWVDDMSAVTVSELWAKCRRRALRLRRDGKRMGIVVVDYIQLLRAPRGGMKREEVIAENARMLKAMAQELDCPVLALSQLNRECEKRPDKRPQLSDLRESGELEQCARTVLLLFRQDYYKTKEDPKYLPTQECEVHVAKQNNGPTGAVKLRFLNESVAFENLPEVGAHDWRDD